MALNKKMHPRNPYKKPPSFKDLALKNTEFRQHAKIEISGKISIDFKNADALRALTRALLKEDWGLDVVLPPEYLVPTLPLRINYILWLEDLVTALTLSGPKSPIYGIDIGTGASCIYPLLAAKKNGWHMVGVEKNETCYNHALENVLRNNFESLVKVHRNNEDTFIDVSVVKGSFEPQPTVFHFTMCNPPFFSSEEEVEKTNKSRSSNCPRPPPHNAHTGSLNEIVVEGGEVAFVCKMIDESFQLKHEIKIFSTMLGHKSSVPKVLQYLKGKSIQEVATTVFCQGHVTRWGVAWSHMVCLTCESLLTNEVSGKQTPKPPMRYIFPKKCDADYTFNSLLQKIKNQFDKLNIKYKCVIKDVKSVGYQVTAQSNTWSNQRRKRREQHRNGASPLNEVLSSPEAGTIVEETSGKTSQGSSHNDVKEPGEPPLKKVKASEPDPLVVMGLVLKEEQSEHEEKQFIVEMCWLSGSGGREAVYQVLQYLKNNI